MKTIGSTPVLTVLFGHTSSVDLCEQQHTVAVFSLSVEKNKTK